MANSFFVILPSTTPNPSDEDVNKPNRFRVHLPKKLEFYDGTWLCGLSSIVYPNSWPAIGTIETQYLDIYLKNGDNERFVIPSGSFTTPKVLEKSLYSSILAEIDKEEKETSSREKRETKKKGRRREEDAETMAAVEAARKKMAMDAAADDQLPISATRREEDAKTKAAVEEALSIATIPPPTITPPPPSTTIPPTTTTAPPQTTGVPSQTTPTREPPKSAAQVTAGTIVVDPKLPFGDSAQFLTEEERLAENERRKRLYKQSNMLAWNEYKEKYRFDVDVTNEKKLMEHRRERMNEFKQMQNRHIGAIILREMELKKKKRRRELAEAVEFLFLEDINKFTLRIKNPEISHVKLSDQISYSLGWDLGNAIKDGEVAKYSYDLKGGVSHICVYANGGLIDDVIFGNRLTPLLQVVGVSGAPGEIIEKKFTSPLFTPVSAKEVDDIQIELRTMEGRLVPFDWGTVIVTLMFKRSIYF